MSREDYRQILAIAARLRKGGFLRRFKTDLIKHDKKTLLTHTGPYLWAVREGGTHLLTPEGACYGYNHDKAWRELPRIFDSEKIRLYHSRGKGAKPHAINSTVAGQIAGKWERGCSIKRDLWTGKPLRGRR